MFHKLTCTKESFNFCLVHDLPKSSFFVYNFENKIKLLSRKLKDEEKIVQYDFEGKEMTTRNTKFEKESQIYLRDKKSNNGVSFRK